MSGSVGSVGLVFRNWEVMNLMSWKFVKKKSTTRDPENRPNYRPDFSGRIGFQATKLNLYRVGFQVTVNPTQYQSYMEIYSNFF